MYKKNWYINIKKNLGVYKMHGFYGFYIDYRLVYIVCIKKLCLWDTVETAIDPLIIVYCLQETTKNKKI